MFFKKGVLANVAGKYLRQSLIFNKVAGLRPTTLLKKRLRYRCFPLNFAKFLRTPFLYNTSGRLLLKVSFFLFFSFSFSCFGNCQLNWKCEYMKGNSWKFLQNSWSFLTFSWFYEYFEWVDCYMNFLPLRSKVCFIFAFAVGEKEKIF